MSEGLVRACPSCGKKNRVLYSRLGSEAHCGSCGAAIPPPSEPLGIDQGSELDGLLRESALPVLVDFWAPWCGPCRMLSPTIDRLAEQFAGKVKVGKLNVDDSPDLASKYGIVNIPRVYIFKGGDQPQKMIVGLTSESNIVKEINSVL